MKRVFLNFGIAIALIVACSNTSEGAPLTARLHLFTWLFRKHRVGGVIPNEKKVEHRKSSAHPDRDEARYEERIVPFG